MTRDYLVKQLEKAERRSGGGEAVSDRQIIEALREAAETLSWCERKMKDLCAGRDDVAGVALAAGRAFDAMREVENRAAIAKARGEK
jgi:hypothetical protein